jgi:predicted outer membrane repeat protein
MNTQQRFKIYLLLILLTGVGLALVVPALGQAYSTTISSRAAPSAAGDIIYVARSGDGSDGLSWITAYTDLQAALAQAVTDDQIWIATGVYTPGLQRSDTFQLVEGVAVYDGFDPEEGADQFSERDWIAYPTVLSADIGDDDTNTNGVVVTTSHIVGDNNYHVVMADGTSTPITGSTRLDGFIITAGQANGSNPDDWGAGLYCDGSGSGGECSPSLRNITFSGNSAQSGGAMWNEGSLSGSSLNEVTFSGNSADVYGGAIFNGGFSGDSSPSLSNVILWSNIAESSGNQIYNLVASVAITTSLVQSGLTVGIEGSGTVTDGGGNIADDPDFVRNPDPGPDGDWDGVDNEYGDLHLGSTFPAIDTGTNSAISLLTDLDGNPRVVDGDGDGTATVDMGAYEFQLLDVYIPLIFR